MKLLWDILSYTFIIYTICIFGFYVILSIISSRQIKFYSRKNSFVDYKDIAESPFTPPISIIAPAHNEELSIVESVNSLLALKYPVHEVIVVNDGSTDDTLKKLIETFDLKKTDFVLHEQLQTFPVRGLYESKVAHNRRLIVVDKDNGGKADALNAGINAARYDLFCAVDADTIIEQDALLKIIKPFLEDDKMIASGGVIRIANNCSVQDGRIQDVNIPKGFFERIQTIEYIRTFLLARMAWSKMNGLLIISGAFGLFNKKIAIAVGGYSRKTVTEDLELVVKMRRYMHDKDLKYSIGYIPDPLCWTEVPNSVSVLARQRRRWSRGLIETMWMHKGMMFNPKYGKLGLVAYPYWFFFEWLAPVIEFIGYLAIIFFMVAGVLNIGSALLLLLFVYCFSVMFSIIALMYDESFTFNNYYKNKRNFWKLLSAAFIEPIGFHQIITWCGFSANFSALFNRKDKWGGQMDREGFKKGRKNFPVQPDEKYLPEQETEDTAVHPGRTAGGFVVPALDVPGVVIH